VRYTLSGIFCRTCESELQLVRIARNARGNGDCIVYMQDQRTRVAEQYKANCSDCRRTYHHHETHREVHVNTGCR
jgi:hypothetical protein